MVFCIDVGFEAYGICSGQRFGRAYSFARRSQLTISSHSGFCPGLLFRLSCVTPSSVQRSLPDFMSTRK